MSLSGILHHARTPFGNGAGSVSMNRTVDPELNGALTKARRAAHTTPPPR